METGDWPGTAEVVEATGLSVVGGGVFGVHPTTVNSAAVRAREVTVRDSGFEIGFEIIMVIFVKIFMGRIPFLSEGGASGGGGRNSDRADYPDWLYL